MKLLACTNQTRSRYKQSSSSPCAGSEDYFEVKIWRSVDQYHGRYDGLPVTVRPWEHHSQPDQWAVNGSFVAGSPTVMQRRTQPPAPELPLVSSLSNVWHFSFVYKPTESLGTSPLFLLPPLILTTVTHSHYSHSFLLNNS